MLAVLEDTVSLGGYDLSVGASAGLAFGQPSELEVTASDLLREADTAMYRSKVQRRHAPVLFDESMRVEVADRIELETALRGALERDELELHYQPVVNLGDGVVCGFEALMRWQHPRLGQVAPDRFIPIAEDNGLILKLGRWAIREAARQLAAWRREYGGDLSMSVNLSAHQMHDPELTATVADALAATGIPPRALCLEITERTLMDDLKTTVATLQVLKQLGVQLSADDFGTGYSSLAYLRRFPFDEVKVDRAFVHGLAEGKGADVIVGAVVSMARALSLTTVAEGVETEEQRAHLLGLGATRGQGHLFSPPCSAETIEGRLGRDRWAQAGTGG
jgi:EAL domain-containing protein (putative c-di-GMP-specific phosphodiesterase class I)